MSAGYFDKAVRLSFGQVAAGAAIEVRHTGGVLADIYSNAAMTTPLSNPGVLGDDGRYEFYALFGVYNITVGAGASAATYRFKLDGDGVNFLTRADFVSAVADGYAPAGGTVVTIGGLSWMVIPDGHADYGTDPISDLPGWMPVGTIAVQHFGDNTAPGTTVMNTAVERAIQYAASLYDTDSQNVAMIDGLGEEIALNAPVDLSDTGYSGWGLDNGTLKAVAGTWPLGKAMVHCDNTSAATRTENVTFSDRLFIEGNHLAMGGIYLNVTFGVRVYCDGHGCREFGVRATTQNGQLKVVETEWRQFDYAETGAWNVESEWNSGGVWSTPGDPTTTPVSGRTCICLDIQTGDCIVTDNISYYCYIPMRWEAGAGHFTGNHPYNGHLYTADADDICAWIGGDSGIVTENYFDNGKVVWVVDNNGTTDKGTFAWANNKFYNNEGGSNSCALEIVTSQANTDMVGKSFVGNVFRDWDSSGIIEHVRWTTQGSGSFTDTRDMKMFAAGNAADSYLGSTPTGIPVMMNAGLLSLFRDGGMETPNFRVEPNGTITVGYQQRIGDSGPIGNITWDGDNLRIVGNDGDNLDTFNALSFDASERQWKVGDEGYNRDLLTGFRSYADFVNWWSDAVAAGYTPPGGAVVTVGGLSWMVIPVGHADYGTDPLSDLPGWMPVGEVYIEHAGGGTGATATANQNALDELFAAYDEVNLGYGSYQLGAGYTVTGDRKRLVGQRQGRTYLYHTGSTCYGIKFAPATLDGSTYSVGGNLQGVTIVGPGVSHTDGIGLDVSMHQGFLCQDVSVQGFRNGTLVSGGQFFSFRDFEVYAPTGGAVADVSDTYLFAVMPFDGGVNGWKHTYNVNISRYQFGADTNKNVQDAIMLGCGDGTRFGQGYVAYGRRSNLCVRPSGPGSAGNITATTFTDTYLDGVDPGSGTGVPYGIYFDTTTETGLTNYIMFGSGCFVGNNTISAVYGHADHMRGVFFDGANISGSGGRNIDIEGTSGASGTRLSLTNCQVRAGEGALFNDLRMLTIDGCQFTDATDNHAIELAGSIGSLVIDGNIMSGNVSDFSSTATITDAAWGDNVGDFGRGGALVPTISYASTSGTPTVATAVGVYSVSGNKVDFSIYLSGINPSSSSGTVTINTNIPSAFNSSATIRQAMSVFLESVATDKSDRFVQARIVGGTTSISIGEMDSGSPDAFNVYDASDVSGAKIAISGTYFM